MRWIAIFDNAPGVETSRLARFDEHQAFLRAHPEITLAGSMRDEGVEAPLGGIWIIKGISRQAAMALCEADPFFVAGVRSGYRLLDFRVAARFDTPI